MKILRVIFVIAVLCAPFYAQQVNQDIVPASPGLYLGHTNQRWNGYFNNADIYNLTINGSPIGTAGIGLPQISIPNGTNCTTLNGLVEFDGNGQAQTASLSSAKVIGVAVSGAGCSGNVLVQYAAIVNCTTDGSTLINDRIAASNSIPGDCMDIGPISIPGIQTVGLVTAVSSGAGQLTSFDLFTGDTISPSSSSGSGVVSVSPCIGPIGYAATAAAIVSWDCNTSLDGSGNAGFKKVTVTGSGAGKIDFGTSTTPGNPSAGFFRLYADSGTGFLTCLNSAGGNCLSSGTAFSALTSGTNTQAAMLVGNGASLAPVNPNRTGQIIGTQAWFQPGLSAPVGVSSNTGGSLLSGHATYILYTLNSALGETLPSIEVAANNIGGFGAGCTSGSTCSITVTAPTLPAGYTGYTVYSRDCNTVGTCGGPELRQTVSAACVNITINCVIQVGGAGANYPTTNTAVVSPPNVQATNGALGFIPSVFFPKADGNYYPWLGVEWNSCDATNGPPTPCGTPMFTHRTWFNDNPANTPVGGKNAFVLIDHLTGTGTVLTNQDRALWVNEQNLSTDVSQHYAMEGIQAEVDVNGAPTWQAAVDAEIATGSFQLQDSTTNSTLPNGGSHVLRASYFSRPTGAGPGFVAGLQSDMSSNKPSGTYGSGTIFSALLAQWETGGTTSTNLTGIGLQTKFPTQATRYEKNIGWYNAGAGAFTVTTGDFLIRNDLAALPSLLNGQTILSGLNTSAVGTLPITASANVIGSATVSQQTMAQAASANCSGGASTYTYVLVGVDNNSGQAPSIGQNTGATCVNPLTAPNPVTLSITGNAAAQLQNSSFIRIDVYRTGGPMALGKIGSLTCTTALGQVGPTCNSFSDTGLTASGTLPTSNSTGTINAAGLQSPIAFTSGALSAGVSSNVTPVTVNANVSTDQNLMAVTLPANGLNVATRNLHVSGAAIYSTPVASVATITMKVKLCTVSGCGSGTVLTPCSYTTSANPGNVTNNSANFVCDITTQTTGASAAFEAHGNLTIDLGATPGLADSIFSDTNTATVGTIDSTAALFLQTTVSFSAASASNSMSERQQITQVTN